MSSEALKAVAESRPRTDVEADLESCRNDIEHMRVALSHIRMLSDQPAFRTEIIRFENLIRQEQEVVTKIERVLEYQKQNGL